MQSTKILFFGTPDIAVPALKILANSQNVEVVGVGVPPDKKVGRKQILTPCPVKTCAQELGLHATEIPDKHALKKVFQETKFDIAIVVAFGMIFPESILKIPKHGIINIHFSLLPHFRGASPIQSAILKGDEMSGITFQKMTKKLDAGDILFQKTFKIHNKPTSQVFTEFAKHAAEMLPDFLSKYTAGKITPTKQDKAKATFCQKFEKSDGEIFPKKETAQAIYKKYLAFDIFPGIFLHTKKGNLKLQKIALTMQQNTVPLQCANDSKIFIERAQLAGKKEMPIADILRGHPNLLENK